MTVKTSVALTAFIALFVTFEAHARDYDSIHLLGRCDYSHYQVGILRNQLDQYVDRYESQIRDFNYWNGRDALLARDALRKAENTAYHGDNISREIEELVRFFNNECTNLEFNRSVIVEVCSNGLSDFCRRFLNRAQ